MTLLVTLAQAKDHLRIVADDEDDKLTESIHHASDVIINYLNDAALTFVDEYGDRLEDSNGEIDVPYAVEAAVLQLITALWEGRGEDGGAMAQIDGDRLPPVVRALLSPLRTPTLA